MPDTLTPPRPASAYPYAYRSADLITGKPLFGRVLQSGADVLHVAQADALPWDVFRQHLADCGISGKVQLHTLAPSGEETVLDLTLPRQTTPKASDDRSSARMVMDARQEGYDEARRTYEPRVERLKEEIEDLERKLRRERDDWRERERDLTRERDEATGKLATQQLDAFRREAELDKKLAIMEAGGDDIGKQVLGLVSKGFETFGQAAAQPSPDAIAAAVRAAQASQPTARPTTAAPSGDGQAHGTPTTPPEARVNADPPPAPETATPETATPETDPDADRISAAIGEIVVKATEGEEAVRLALDAARTIDGWDDICALAGIVYQLPVLTPEAVGLMAQHLRPFVAENWGMALTMPPGVVAQLIGQLGIEMTPERGAAFTRFVELVQATPAA